MALGAGMNSYDGPGYVEGQRGPLPRRDGVKKTHREIIKRFREIGEQALNAADYERTRHLAVGRGRLACDPETGDFDADVPRPHYNPSEHPDYPRYVHSTITDGESMVVFSADERANALATRKWADKPLEKRKRFTLTPEDQMQNLKGQIEAERAGRLEMEKRLESTVVGSGTAAPEEATLLKIQLEQERQERLALEARFNTLIASLEKKGEAEEEDENLVPAARMKRR